MGKRCVECRKGPWGAVYIERCTCGSVARVWKPAAVRKQGAESLAYNIGEVPQFPSKLSTMRKYNISATVILQDISQIESMYKDEWKTIVGNCSSIVFLGTQEPNTLKYFSEMLGKGTVKNKSRGVSKGKSNGSNQSFQNTGRELMFPDELARMPSSECIVFTQNMRPVRDDKYKYERHPRYHLTADADNTLGFQYNTMPAYDNNHRCNISSLLKAKAEAARAREEQMVTDGRTLDKKARTPLATEEALDRLEFPSEEATYLAYTEDLQRQWLEDKHDLAQARAEHLPVKRLLRILKQSLPVIPEKTLLGITDLHLPDHKVAVAVSDPDLIDCMKNQFAEGVELRDGFVVAWVNKNLLDDYLKAAEKAFQKRKAS